MSRPFITVGDRTDHGGGVITGSAETDIDGKPVARVGDRVTCPKCKGAFPIVSGDNSIIIDGQPVARHGDKTACGATLFSSQIQAFTDPGPSQSKGNSSSAATATATGSIKRFGEQYRAIEESTGKPIAGQPYRIDLEDGTTHTGKTDKDGLTMRVSTNTPMEVRLTWLNEEHMETAITEDTMEGC